MAGCGAREEKGVVEENGAVNSSCGGGGAIEKIGGFVPDFDRLPPGMATLYSRKKELLQTGLIYIAVPRSPEWARCENNREK